MKFYILCDIEGVASFASNFMKKASMKYGLLTLAGVLLTVFCYMGYMRQSAETVFAVFPLLAVGITPILGNYVDHKGKAASMLMIGSMLLVLCHLTFAFVLPEFRDNAVVDFAEGDMIVVIGGVWKDTVGVITAMNYHKQTVTINVELFGRETPVEVSFADVKKTN